MVVGGHKSPELELRFQRLLSNALPVCLALWWMQYGSWGTLRPAMWKLWLHIAQDEPYARNTASVRR